jgi:hypothetical protein
MSVGLHIMEDIEIDKEETGLGKFPLVKEIIDPDRCDHVDHNGCRCDDL